VPDDEAGLDARLLAQFLLRWDAVRFLADARRADSPDFASRYAALVERRARREPLAYITGEREFWGLPFDVSPAVLIPRPETELIVEAALKQFPDASAAIAIADVCTGSGCLAVALAHERSRGTVVATDIAEAALQVARRNAARHGVDARVRFVCTDLLRDASGPFDLIVANPPYVPARDRDSLAPEVRDYEPAIALFGGDDGLRMIPELFVQAAARLAPGGRLIVEFGFGQAEAIEGLIAASGGLTMQGIEKDLQGIPRIAVAARSNA
jgi:release factor glutamine methyltransferase